MMKLLLIDVGQVAVFLVGYALSNEIMAVCLHC